MLEVREGFWGQVQGFEGALGEGEGRVAGRVKWGCSACGRSKVHANND